MKRSSGFSKLISESVHPLTLIFDVAFECSKITIIISHNIFQSFSRNVSGGSVSITYKSVEDDFKDALEI